MSHASWVVSRGAHGGGSCGRVVHTHGSLAVCLAGAPRIWMGSVWSVRPGDVVLVPDGAPHHRLDRGEVHWVGLALCMPCLPRDRWGLALRGMFGRVAHASPVLRPEEPELRALVREIEALECELRAPTLGSELAVDGLLSVITARLLRAEPVRAVLPEGGTPLVGRALRWVGEHAHETISLVDVAAALGRAPTYLAARVKQETGHPVGYWIESARMALARDLLLRCEDTVEVLAQRVGYTSPSHFHRTFRRAHGTSPAAWRKLHGEEANEPPVGAPSPRAFA